MGVAWIQMLDVVGAFLGFTVLFAVLLMLGKVSNARSQSRHENQRSL